MDQYTPRHKYFLQLICRERMYEQRKLNAIHKEIFKSYINVSLDETINLINSKLRLINMRISQTICEMTEKMMYVLHTTVKPKVNMFENFLTLSQKEFMSLVFQGIIMSDEGKIRTSTALNYCNSLKTKGIKLVEAEQLMTDLIKHNLLMYTDKNKTHICLTPLTILEMEFEIRESFSDILDCSLCKQILLKGVTCNHCGIKIHLHCLKRFSVVLKCPHCKKLIDLS